MIVRIVLAGLTSFIGGFCYLAGLMRLMTGLLIGFGVVAALFFGVVFLLPAGDQRLWFPVYGGGASWPFFLLALLLAGMIGWVLVAGPRREVDEPLEPRHYKLLAGGLLVYLCALFIPAFWWFPPEAKRLTADASRLGLEVVVGVCLYLAGSSVALYLLYRASRGATRANPHLMRRFVPALFAFLQLDKVPALIAYLLIYSPETYVIFPKAAALALAGYIPVGCFLAWIALAVEDDSA